MPSIGLVLGAGGVLGGSFHAGVIAALEAEVGFDSRDAALIVGTSAGANTATSLRAGLSPADHLAVQLGQSLSVEGRAVAARAPTQLELPAGTGDQSAPGRWASPRLLLAALPGRGRPARPVLGLVGSLPRGRADGSSIARRSDELHPDGWPTEPVWIVAVDYRSGRRIVFGRDDTDHGTGIGTAVQASSAVPSVFEPVRIAERELVDGGIHSSTNADVVAGLQFDLVVVAAPMAAVAESRSWRRNMSRAWHGRTVDQEAALVASSGTPTIVVSPTEADLDVMGDDNMDGSRRAATALRAYETTRRLLDRTPAELTDVLATGRDVPPRR